MSPKKLAIVASFFIVAIAGITFLSWSSVDDSSPTDREYLAFFLKGIKRPAEIGTYDDEIRVIRAIQKNVLTIAPTNKGIPIASKRGLKQLYILKHGLCFDRSRAIEIVLRSRGFETRHIAIYSTEQTHSSIMSLLTPQIESHAITEVKTSMGWLVVDSNAPWLAIGNNGTPLSIQEIRNISIGVSKLKYKTPAPKSLYTKHFTYVYGLYSRHGKFYPPYNFVPDINYGEFIDNFW